MVATLPNEAMILEERRRETLSRLARRYPQFHAEPDPVSGGHIVRNEKVPGRVTVVDAQGRCSCARGRLFDICKHIAAVEALGGAR